MQENKAALARSLGISRSTLYYTPKRPVQDQAFRDLGLTVRDKHPAYGHGRAAIHVGVNKRRVLRIMRKYKIYPTLHRKRRIYGQRTLIMPIPNRLRETKPIRVNQA